MSLGVSPDITTSGSDGSTDLYASPSGMVGAEINGVWIMALPPERTVYRTNYAGTNVVIARYGDRYSITMPGVPVADRLRRYNPRFLTGSISTRAETRTHRPRLSTLPAILTPCFSRLAPLQVRGVSRGD